MSSHARSGESGDGRAGSPGDAPASIRRVAVLVGTLVALAVIGSSAVAVALPELATEMRLLPADAAWVLAAFGVTFSIATAVFGRLGDLWGLRRALTVGLTLFTAGSLLAGAAWSFPALVAGRLLQGAGGGAVPVLALGILTARFRGRARSRAVGGLTAVVSAVSASGPLIGGALTALGSWRLVVALPAVAALLGVPIARLAPGRPAGAGEGPGSGAGGGPGSGSAGESPDGGTAVGHPEAPATSAPSGWPAPGRSAWRSLSSGAQRFDVVGAALVGLTVTGVTLLLQAPATGLGHAALAGLAGVTAAAAGGAVWRVRRHPEGFLPAAVVGRASFRRSAGAALTLLAAYIGALFALPLLLTDEQGWSPLVIGVALVPAALAGAVASQIVGRIAGRVAHHKLAAGLATLSATGVLVAAASRPPALLVVGMAMIVVGFAGGQAALVDAVAAAADDSVRGATLGVFNLVYFVGAAVGAATVGGLTAVTTLRGALAALAVLPACGAVAALGARR